MNNKFLLFIFSILVLIAFEFLHYKFLCKKGFDLKRIQLFYVISIQLIYIPPLIMWFFWGYKDIINLFVVIVFNIGIVLMAQLLKTLMSVQIKHKKYNISTNGIMGARMVFLLLGSMSFSALMDLYRSTPLFIVIIIVVLLLMIYLRQNIIAFFKKPDFTVKSFVAGMSLLVGLSLLWGIFERLDPNSKNTENSYSVTISGVPGKVKLLFIGAFFVLCVASLHKYSVFSRVSTYFSKNNILYQNDKNNEPLE